MGEYEALIQGLCVAKVIGIKRIVCCGDSDLVAQQVAGTWNARNPMLAAYRDEVEEIAKSFLGYKVKYVPREQNEAAGLLSKLGLGRKKIPPGVFLEHLRTPSVKGADIDNPDKADSFVNMVTKIPLAWIKLFMEYLEHGTLPDDKVERRKIVRRAKGYTIINGQLYKRSTTGVYLKCVSQLEGMEILREIHI